MGTDRIKRINELLRREIGEALFRVLGAEDGVDIATLTVTHVETSRNLRHARVYVSIRATDDEAREVILGRLRRHTSTLQAAINRDLKIKYTPKLQFLYDPSIERGSHVLDVLASLEAEADPTDASAAREETDL